jgi:TonB family protein
MYVLVLLVSTVIGLRAQQAAPQANPQETGANTDAAVQFRPAPEPPEGKVWSCPTKFEFNPELDGIYKVGGDVKPPKVTNNVEAEFSDEARQESRDNPYFQATAVLYLIVDIDGKPKDICIQTLAGHGLDIQALKAVKQYRFRPATKNGKPVAARIKLEVTFRRG